MTKRTATKTTNRLSGIPLNQAAANRLGLPRIVIDFSKVPPEEKQNWIHTSFEEASPSTREGNLALVRPPIADVHLDNIRSAVNMASNAGDDPEITPDAGDFIVCYWNSKDQKHDKDCRRITREQLKSGEY